MKSSGSVRRVGLAAVVACTGVFATRTLLYAHATLLSSEPAAKSVLTKSPERIRLVFSEAVDASVSGITVTTAGAPDRVLTVAADPHDVHAIIAPVSGLSSGAYRVAWRTVSDDGHKVTGSFTFTIEADSTVGTAHAAATLPPPPPDTTKPGMSDDPDATSGAWGPTLFGASIIAALLRGAAVFTLMAFVGLLFFARGSTLTTPAVTTLLVRLGTVAFVLLATHLLAWTVNTEAHTRFDVAWSRSMLGTGTGKLELGRLAACSLALWGLVVARRHTLALVFGVVALALTAGIGHPAAMHSGFAIPSNAAHLMGSAIWLGGLIWLTVSRGADLVTFVTEARRVSKVALIAVLVVGLTGVNQSFMFLETLPNLLHTDYGRLVFVKIAGLLILVGLGAYHRYRVMPTLTNDANADGLRRSVRKEILVIVLVTLVAGLLSYLPPHRHA